MSDPRPIGVFDSGVGGLTVLREILRRTPAESTIYLGDNARAPYGVRSDDEVLAFSIECARPAGRARRQGDRRRLQHLDRGRARRPPPALRPADPGRHPARARRPPRWPPATGGSGVIATPATIRSHAYFGAIKDENPAVEVYEHATPTLVPLVEAGELAGPRPRRAVAEALAPLLGERDAAGESIFPRPPGATIDTLLLGCTHYPLLRAAHRGVWPVSGSRSSIRRRPPRRRWPSCSTINAARGTRDAGGRRARDEPATHRQLTTGDAGLVPRPRRAGCSAPAFPDVEHVELAVRGPMSRTDSSALARRRPVVARRPASGRPGFLIGSALGRRGDRRRPPRRAGRAPRPRRLAGGRAHRDRPAARRARAPSTRPSCGPPSRPTPRRWRGSCRALGAALGSGAARRRRALRRRRPGRLGPRQHRLVRAR